MRDAWSGNHPKKMKEDRRRMLEPTKQQPGENDGTRIRQPQKWLAKLRFSNHGERRNNKNRSQKSVCKLIFPFWNGNVLCFTLKLSGRIENGHHSVCSFYLEDHPTNWKLLGTVTLVMETLVAIYSDWLQSLWIIRWLSQKNPRWFSPDPMVIQWSNGFYGYSPQIQILQVTE